MTAMTPTARPASTSNAEAELDRVARRAQSEHRITYAEAYHRVLIATRACTWRTWSSIRARPEAAMAEFLIPRTTPKFAGTTVTLLDVDEPPPHPAPHQPR